MPQHKKMTPKEWEKLDHARMQVAVREIAESPNLRFFILSFLNASGVDVVPYSDTDRSTVFACGRQSVGHDIIATLRTHNPSLYLTLLEEDQNEQSKRGG